MAKLGDNKFSFTEIQKFYRVPVSCCGDHCYLNVGKNSIVKVIDQKPLHTWTLTHPNYFTSPIVYFNENLYCVINHDILMKWSVNEDNLKNAEKIKFQEPIFALLSVPGKQPLLFFESGKFATTDGPHAIELVHVSQNQELLWVDVSVSEENTKLFVLVCNTEDGIHTLHCCSLNDEEQDKFSNLANNEAHLLSWCLNSFDSSFLSLWSDGIIYLHKNNDLDGLKVLQIKELEVNASAAITYVDATHIAVAFSNLQQKECVLEVWDTRFSVLKAKKTFKASNINNLQVLAQKSTIFLYFNKEMISIPFELDRSTLAAAMGKSTPDAQPLEFSWDAKGELLENPVQTTPERMEMYSNEVKSAESVELVAQRLLHQNMKYLMYIPESELAKLLRIAIRHSTEERNDKSTKDAVSIILNIIFSASFNDIFLVKYLKRMNLEETLVALELLLSHLNHTVEVSSSVNEKPSDLQIVNWTCLIIQSHMEALLLSKDKKSRKLLKKLENALCIKTEEYEDYEVIQNYFTILKKKDALPEKCSAGKYCIESLDI